jgi:hypothetical protein
MIASYFNFLRKGSDGNEELIIPLPEVPFWSRKGQECPHCDKHDNNPRDIKSESRGEPSQTKEACVPQGSRGHKDLKVGGGRSN